MSRTSSAAADGAAAAALLRREVGGLIARAAAGEAVDGGMRSHHAAALASVQSAAAALDFASAGSCAPAGAVGAKRSAGWPPQHMAARSPAVPGTSDVDQEDVSDLLQHAISCLPPSSADSCSIAVRAGGRGGERQLEMLAEGVFSAVICVVPSEVAGGDGWGSSAMVWLPTRLSIGPTYEVAPAGASHPPSSQVFQDLCARGGGVLAGLGRLAAAHRLRPLIRWLASLSGLFQTVCCGCGEVFPPMPASAADLLPPTARCEQLLPYHPRCYRGRFGREAEEAFVEAEAVQCNATAR